MLEDQTSAAIGRDHHQYRRCHGKRQEYHSEGKTSRRPGSQTNRYPDNHKDPRNPESEQSSVVVFTHEYLFSG
jgi:hypothetical protein